MSQAHKTVGAFVELKDKTAEFADLIFEVIDPNKYTGHLLCKDVVTNSEIVLHDNEVQTVSKACVRKLRLNA